MTHTPATMASIVLHHGTVPSAGCFLVRRDITDPTLLSEIDHGIHGRAAQRGVYLKPGVLAEQLPYEELARAALLSINNPDAVVVYNLVALYFDIDLPAEKMKLPACVNIPRRYRRPSRKGIHIHTAGMWTDDIVYVGPRKDVPMSTPTRLLIDIGRDRSWTAYQIAMVAENALHKELTSAKEIVKCLWRCRNFPNIARAARILAACAGLTESPAEVKAMLALAQGHVQEPALQYEIDIPQKLRDRPETRPKHPHGKQLPEYVKADFAWPDYRLIVEIDGRTDHTDPIDVDYDKRRQWALEKLRWRVLRFTGSEVFKDPKKFAARVQKVLDQQIFRQRRQ
jgi:very-short-patch-repair endonuclease